MTPNVIMNTAMLLDTDAKTKPRPPIHPPAKQTGRLPYFMLILPTAGPAK